MGTKKKPKNIGIEVNPPSKKCTDGKCPFHGSLRLRGRIFTGTVITARMQKTVTVERIRQYYIPKYERYEKRRSRIKAHNPECINAKEGDIVKISECRPLSKTKNFVVIEVIGKEKGFKEKMELREEAKKKVKKEKKIEGEEDKGKPKEEEKNAST